MTDISKILVAGARGAYFGPGLNLDPHHNATTTIAIALRAPFDIKLCSVDGQWSDWSSEVARIIPANSHHHLIAKGPMAFFYLDPLSDDQSHILNNNLISGRENLLKMAEPSISKALEVLGVPTRNIIDKKIAEVIKSIEENPQDFQTLDAAAKIACLSPSRFRARFMEEMGIPFRRYRLWRRMAKVMSALSQGKNLTEAAILSGFSSSSHLSTAFKSMFGLSPNAILSMNIDCDEDETFIHQVNKRCSG